MSDAHLEIGHRPCLNVTLVATAWNPPVLQLRECLVSLASRYPFADFLQLHVYVGTYDALPMPFPARLRETLRAAWANRRYEAHLYVFDMVPECGLKEYKKVPASFAFTESDDGAEILTRYNAWHRAAYARDPKEGDFRTSAWLSAAECAHDIWAADHGGTYSVDARFASAYAFDEDECTRGW